MPRRRELKLAKAVPALVYPQCYPDCVLSCDLLTKGSNDEKSFTLYLRFPIWICESRKEQYISFQYDADRLAPRTTELKNAEISLDDQQLRRLARQGRPDIKTLCLSLQEGCFIWCPKSAKSITPVDKSATQFRRLGTLAQARAVSIVFDYNSFRDERLKRMELLLKHTSMTGVGTDGFQREYRLAGLTIFGVDEEVEYDNPPSYTPGPYNPTAKRGRRKSGSILGPSISRS